MGRIRKVFPYGYFDQASYAPVLVSIAVTPANSTVVTGTTKQMTATGTYNDASTADITATAAWASSVPADVTIAPGGLATGVAPGATVISATVGTIVGITGLTDVAPFDPTTFALSTYQRDFAGALPWVGTASAGISGAYREIHLGTDPDALGPTLNGVVGARYTRGTNSQTTNAANVPQVMETFVSNAAYTISFMLDIEGAGTTSGPPYQSPQMFAADAHWGWGITAKAAYRGGNDITINAAAQTLTQGAGGDFTTDGFAIGDIVYIRRTLHNDGFVSVPVSAISASTLTFAGGNLVDEVILNNKAPCVTAGPYLFNVFNYSPGFPVVSYTIQPGVRWIYCRRVASGTIQVDIDGVPGVQKALTDHTGASGVAAQTNNSLSGFKEDVVLYERYTALVSQSDAQRANYGSYLNVKFARAY